MPNPRTILALLSKPMAGVNHVGVAMSAQAKAVSWAKMQNKLSPFITYDDFVENMNIRRTVV